jgi:L-serine dehydratase
MSQISIFDLFKIGIGPSSSHTVGPMRAARHFVERLDRDRVLAKTTGVKVEMFGSLALTGLGHGTDKAVLLGLRGELPESVNCDEIDATLLRIRSQREIYLLGRHPVRFVESEHLLFLTKQLLPKHSNGMRFSAFAGGELLAERSYYSVGGGFILSEGEQPEPLAAFRSVAFPFSTAAELLSVCAKNKFSIHEVVFENERTWRAMPEIEAGLEHIWQVMHGCMQRGLSVEGILPGGLNVRRRAPVLARKLTRKAPGDPLDVMDWVNIFAMAVNEENAAGGRVVTAPTNGAAGVIPAVLQYYSQFVPGASAAGRSRFLLTAGAIGLLYKTNASISGAEVGCQGEVGVACSMAAAGLTSALDGTNEQIEHAAEIGMEHHLGMTCDPVGGLVQIPCIERNAVGAVKAIMAARMAQSGDGLHRVSLDQVMRTMFQTGLDMHARYKETSQAGLAVSVVNC